MQNVYGQHDTENLICLPATIRHAEAKIAASNSAQMVCKVIVRLHKLTIVWRCLTSRYARINSIDAEGQINSMTSQSWRCFPEPEHMQTAQTLDFRFKDQVQQKAEQTLPEQRCPLQCQCAGTARSHPAGPCWPPSALRLPCIVRSKVPSTATALVESPRLHTISTGIHTFHSLTGAFDWVSCPFGATYQLTRRTHQPDKVFVLRVK